MAAYFSIEEVLKEVVSDEQKTDEGETSNDVQHLEMSVPGISRMLFSCNVNIGQLFRKESVLWLKGIFRRLAGRRNIRRPFFSKIVRDMPEGVYMGLLSTIKRCQNPLYCEPNCYVAESKKMSVMSFQSLLSVENFLSSLSMEDASGYLDRVLKGSRKDHRAKLLVSEIKDFALIYHFQKGQFELSFYFGEWNKFGFPQHNCQL